MKSFEIKCNNIGFEQINELIKGYSEISNLKRISVQFKKKDSSNLYGEIDPIFLSYLILFIKQTPDLNVEFIFEDIYEKADRLFSLSHQLNHIIYLTKINHNQFKIDGSYINKSTGEIKSILNLREPEASKSFIPPIYIDSEEKVKEYFSNNYSILKENDIIFLFEAYETQIKKDIDTKIGSFKKKEFIESLEISKLSFVECCLLRLILDEDKNVYEDSRRKGSYVKNRKYIESSLVTTKNISKGLRELALNIVQHSTDKKGVVTIRKFEQERLESLKGLDENNYLKLNGCEWFLDINVIDLGNENIRKKYLDNIQLSRDTLIKKIKNYSKPNIKVDDLKEIVKIDFDNDLNYIENNQNFGYHNFFLSDSNSINNLSIQKNKFITKIGLQHFSNIVLNRFDGFVKTSSGTEKAIFFNEVNGDKKTINKSIVNHKDFVHSGTFYHCLIPIKKWKTGNINNKKDKPKLNNPSANTFTELKKFNEVKFENLDKDYKLDFNNIIHFSPRFEEGTKTKYDNFYDIFLELYFNEKRSQQNDILTICCKSIKDKELTDSSEWQRFIWTLNDLFENIILYDIDFSIFKGIIDYRKLNEEVGENKFWDETSRVLFYSKKQEVGKPEYFRYGANLLAGHNSEDFNYLNSKIWRHHYSHREEVFDFPENDLRKVNSHHLDSIIFNGSNLHYFEVLLKTATENESEITLFEKSVQYSLNTLFLKKRTNNTNNKGYKINNTHFRLGSKIHISDFYYAKKIFQNSFFTTPLAFLLSEDIWMQFFKNGSEKIKRISLVGYDNYSSFLLSSIRNFLEKKIHLNYNEAAKKNGEELINHFTISRGGILSREPKKLNENIIIIVPISTTFNTSLKIEDQLIRVFNKNKIDFDFKKLIFNKCPYYNIVLVAHKDVNYNFLENYLDENLEVLKLVNNKPSIYFQNNWSKADKKNKIITVEKYDEDSRDQKYYIPVYTTWHLAENCKYCFPEKNNFDEKCLVETGSASITPQLIFGFPKTKAKIQLLDGEYYKGLYLEGSLLYGHLKNSKNRYLYFNKTGRVVNDNKKNIINWLEGVKSKFKNEFDNKKIVIVAPETNTRSNFLDLINEHLFDYSANCIIVSLKEDYIENSETLYTDGLHSADLVIYVDDVLSTIKSFLETNYIIKYIRNKNKSGKGIDYCISLINRMSFADEENLLLKLLPLINNDTDDLVKLMNRTKELQYETKDHSISEKIKPAKYEQIENNLKKIKKITDRLENEQISFDEVKDRLIYYEKMNNPTIEESNTTFPLKIERRVYKKLMKQSSLDALSEYFNKKSDGISSNNLKKSLNDKIKDYSFNNSGRRNKKLYQLLVLNALYSIFEYNIDTEKFGKERLEKLHDYFPLVNSHFNQNIDIPIFNKSLNKLENRIISILNEDSHHKYIIEDNKSNLKSVIFKIICSTPLIYYKEIRDPAFYWVLIELVNLESKINTTSYIAENLFLVKNGSYYTDYQDFKFLLKRSVKLKSNFLIHKNTFSLVKTILTELKNIENKNILNPYDELNERNKIFENEIAKFIKKDYINIPIVKLKLFDFILNFSKDEIISKDFIFENKKEISKYSTEDYKFLIEEVHIYKNKIIKSLEGVLPPILDNERPVVLREDKDNYELFKSDFLALQELEKYKISTAKKLIHHLIALIQELVYEHETKSLKLDKTIDELCNSDNTYEDNFENGNFNHFIRLIRLENTEIITMFSKYLINKEIKEENGTINIVNLNYLNDNYKNDLKYKQVKRLQNEEYISLKNYLELKVVFYNFNKCKEYKLNTTIEGIIELFLLKLTNILTNKENDLKVKDSLIKDVYFTINYNNEAIKEKQEFYTFSLYNGEELEIVKNSKSISKQILQGINSECSNKSTNRNGLDYHLSNLEIIKKENGEVKHRDNICSVNESALLIDNQQIYSLNKNASILFIRISDFINVGNNELEVSQKLYGQAVITIYLNQAKRVNEKRLRLILALRRDFSKFIKNRTSGTTFLELITELENKKFQKHLKHGIGYYTSYQMEIVQEFENIQSKISVPFDCVDTKYEIEKQYISFSSKKFREFRLLNNSIKGQIGVNESKKEKNNSMFFYEYFIDLLKTIYSSKRLTYRDKIPLNYEVEVKLPMNEVFNPVIIPTSIMKSVIPELIFNQKKYGENREVSWIDNEEIFCLTFKNNINKYGYDGIKGYGTNMCKEIESKYKNVNIIEEKGVNSYTITVKIYKDESINN